MIWNLTLSQRTKRGSLSFEKEPGFSEPPAGSFWLWRPCLVGLMCPWLVLSSMFWPLYNHPAYPLVPAVQSLGPEDLLEEGTATHSSILAWRIPWTEEPGRLQSMGSQRVRHDRSDSTHLFSHTQSTRRLGASVHTDHLSEGLYYHSCNWFLQLPCSHLELIIKWLWQPSLDVKMVSLFFSSLAVVLD